MRPLTDDVWERHYVELRPYVLERFAKIDEQHLESVGGDFRGLHELVQRATGLSADSALQMIRTMDVEELHLGTGGSGDEADPDETARGNANLANNLSLGTGFRDDERSRIVDRMKQLDRHLRRFPADATYLELSVKDREGTAQVVTLEVEAPGFRRFVAKSKESDLRAALADVRDDAIDQIQTAVGKKTEGVR